MTEAWCPGGCCTDLNELPIEEIVLTPSGEAICVECYEPEK